MKDLKKGDIFNRLTFLNFSETNKNKAFFHCSCGNDKEIDFYNVIGNKTKSCGCWNRENSLKQLEKARIKNTLSFGEAAFHEILGTYKRNAKKRNLEFDLSKEEFKEIILKDCFYCGDKPSQKMISKNKEVLFVYNGVDRKDNKLGYVKSNVVPCCGFCNCAKSNLTEKDFLDKISKIYNKNFIKTI